MNPSDLENELRALRPSAPPADLEKAIGVELARLASTTPTAGVIARPRESRLARLLGGLCWAMGGAAAAVIATVYLSVIKTAPQTEPVQMASAKRSQSAAPSYFEPTESDRELLWAEASDLVYDEDEQPAQVLSYTSIERHVWANPTTGARLEVEVPREDRVLVPISFQ